MLLKARHKQRKVKEIWIDVEQLTDPLLGHKNGTHARIKPSGGQVSIYMGRNEAGEPLPTGEELSADKSVNPFVATFYLNEEGPSTGLWGKIASWTKHSEPLYVKGFNFMSAAV